MLKSGISFLAFSCLAVAVSTAHADAFFFTNTRSDGKVDQYIMGSGTSMDIKVEVFDPFNPDRLLVTGLNGTTFGNGATSRLVNVPSGDLIIDGRFSNTSSVECLDLQFVLQDRLQILSVNYVTVEGCFLFFGRGELVVSGASVTNIDVSVARKMSLNGWWTSVRASGVSNTLRVSGRGRGCHVRMRDGVQVGQSMYIYGTSYRDNIDLNDIRRLNPSTAKPVIKIYGYNGNDFAYLTSVASRYVYMNGGGHSDTLDYRFRNNSIDSVSVYSVETVK